MTYAAYPHVTGIFLDGLFDKFLPGWRDHAANPIEVDSGVSAHMMKELGPMIDAIEATKKRPND